MYISWECRVIRKRRCLEKLKRILYKEIKEKAPWGLCCFAGCIAIKPHPSMTRVFHEPY